MYSRKFNIKYNDQGEKKVIKDYKNEKYYIRFILNSELGIGRIYVN